MRYYVEINGESSLDIQGLMIQSLPSISKPLMRSKQETIDGRDGDIVTKLGYSAYDKTIKIGLWGNYDINEVIAFFNQEGTITFSNEPDKYYRFTILNRDDYVSQLDKFRTCTIALHCQPYKYKLNEEAEELENEYVEQEGTSLTFINTLEAPMNIDLKGNTLQNGTPTPSSPIPINNVSGDNDIVVCGKNLFNGDTFSNPSKTHTSGGITSTISQNEISCSGTASSTSFDIGNSSNVFELKLENNTKYTFSRTGNTTKRLYIRLYNYNKSQQRDVQIVANSTSTTFTTNFETYYCYLFVVGTTAQESVYMVFSVQIEKGETATTYEAYNGTTYNIDLPVENLLDISQWQQNKVVNNSSGEITNSTNNAASEQYMSVQPNTTYTFSSALSCKALRVGTYRSDKTFIERKASSDNVSSWTFTTDANTYYLRWNINYNDTTITQDIIDSLKLQINKGQKNSFTPYGTTPIELNKTGTYQDYIYKDNDKWYLHKETKKLDMSTIIDWVKTDDGSFFKSGFVDTYGIKRDTLLSNIFQYSTENWYDNGYFGIASSGNMWVKTGDSSLTTATAFTNWLSNKGAIMYGILTTPTNTEITYQPLIEQLESIKNAMSKEGTTNVNQVNNDLPFIITASVLSGTDSITLTNEGNTTSKPTLTITGSGVIGVYLENIQMFNISLGTNETIIIDTENMEAYYGSQLKNRQVTGDYSNFALQSGTNNLKFTGVVTNVEITNYNRWI